MKSTCHATANPRRKAEIRILSDRVANQIAAGEVIERPVAVVKELLENSLDAGATRVEIEFRSGGKSYIRVEDNGCGMSPDESLLALERHATSKIRKAEDLLEVGTFGFRGEALPSIAGVSRFSIRTRNAEWDHGTEILVNGGKFIHRKDCGMPVGTRIEVAHLFNSVPARRKFLKTENTEAAHIVHLARLYAVAHPDASFTLLEKGRRIFQSPVSGGLLNRVAEVFGRQLAHNLIEIRVEDDGFGLGGLIGKPGVGRSTRQELVTYVNQRLVDSRTLNLALIEAYHTYIPKGRYPIAFLFLELDPSAVDVNVHPAKKEVRFREEGRIRQFVINGVLSRLRDASGGESEVNAGQETRPVPVESLRPASDASRLASSLPRSQGGHPPSTPSEPAGSDGDDHPSSLARDTPSRINGVSLTSPWRYLGLAHEVCSIFETDAGIVVLNCRAAIERIHFEEIFERLRDKEILRQKLLFPTALELDSVLSATLEEHLSFFSEAGFDIEPFGRNFYRIEALPDWLHPSEAENFLRDLLGLIRERGLNPVNREFAHEELARRAALLAAKSEPLPSREEMEALAVRLLACRNPLTDSRGNATFFEFSQADLERKFKGSAAT